MAGKRPDDPKPDDSIAPSTHRQDDPRKESGIFWVHSGEKPTTPKPSEETSTETTPKDNE